MTDMRRILTDAIHLLETRHYEQIKLAMRPDGKVVSPHLALSDTTVAVSMRGALMAVATSSAEASYAIRRLNIRGTDPKTRADAIWSLKAALASLDQTTTLDLN